MAHGLEGSGCHFENILDFTVRNPQAAHNSDSDSVASDVSGDLDIGKQVLAHWLDFFPKAFSLSFPQRTA